MPKTEKLEVREIGRGGNQRSIKSMLASKDVIITFNRAPTDAEFRNLSINGIQSALVK